jgi:uncharacterized protein YhjY with autotransporter beta-barrel domain
MNQFFVGFRGHFSRRFALRPALAVLLGAAASGSAFGAPGLTANSEAQLNADIATINTTPGTYTITITGSFALTSGITAINSSVSNVTIVGGSDTITGAGNQGFTITAGTVAIQNLNITGTTATGGTGAPSDPGGGGGGGLGAGGAVYVGAAANVTLTSVNFTTSTAQGGGGGSGASTNHGAGGGGGLNGGNGSASTTSTGGNGGSGPAFPGSGGTGGAGSTVANGSTGGNGTAGGGGGGGGEFTGNQNHSGGNGGAGGNGAGGGGGGGNTHNGSAAGAGGAGGFGAGGGGGGLNSASGQTGAGGAGGEGGGNGTIGSSGNGGGGAGFGGAVFVQAGGTLNVTGTQTYTGNTATGGAGGSANGTGQAGAGAGSDIFLTSGTTSNFSPGTGHTITFNGTIADDSPNSLPTGGTFGAGTGAGAPLVIGSSALPGGTVIFNATNTYAGTTTIQNGTTLQLGNGTTANGLAGPGNIIDNSTLAFDEHTTTTIANNITGSGGVNQIGAGMAILASTVQNTYSGGTVITLGTLRLTTVAAASANSDYSVQTGQTLDLAAAVGNQTRTIGALNDIAGATGGTITNSGFRSALLHIGTNGDSGTFSGTIQNGVNSITLFKDGAGTETLTGANTFTGGATVTAGFLVDGNATGLGDGNISLTGGTIMLGNSNRLITDAGNYTQNSGNGTLLISINNAGFDHLNLTTGTAFLGAGTLEVNLAGLTPLGTTLGGTSTPITMKDAVITTTHAVNGQFASFVVENAGAGVTATVDYTTNPDDVFVDLTLAGGPQLFSLMGLDPNEVAIVNNINNSLSHGINNPLFLALGQAITQNPSGAAAYLDQLSPEEFGRFASETAFNNATFEIEAMDNYLEEQHSGPNGTFLGGNGGIDSSGLTINDPAYDPNLAMIHSRMMAWSPGPLDGTVSDMANPLLGGVEMKDSKDMKSMAPPAYTNPWNFFVRGNVILAQGFSQQDVSHFDDNTESVEVGTDYRISPNFLIGLVAGYGHTDVTLDDNGSSATVDSYSPGFYASYANKGWYANLQGNYVHNAYTQDRKIAFLGQDANSAPEGNEGVADIDGGYDFHSGALTYGPLAGLQYTHLSVDGYQETGSIADLSVDGQQADSLRSRLGGRVAYSFSHYGLVFHPHLDASWQHEFMDQARGITSQFNSAGLGSFSVRTENPSRDFALADVGMDAEINCTMDVFLDYVVQAGQDNYFGQSVQGGLKIGF